MIRILIADDQPKVRHALRLILEQEVGITVVGEAAEVKGIMAQITDHCPDVILLDWGLLGKAQIDQLSDLRQACPGIRVIVLSGRSSAGEEALAAGAAGFVSKTDPPETLLKALRQA
jgi:DNA-binding NarL/FixJ family response regulator